MVYLQEAARIFTVFTNVPNSTDHDVSIKVDERAKDSG